MQPHYTFANVLKCIQCNPCYQGGAGVGCRSVAICIVSYGHPGAQLPPKSIPSELFADWASLNYSHTKVVEKELLIQEKEKLYMELKQILQRQPGPEVAEQLQIYQQTLKEKTKQMKVRTAGIYVILDSLVFKRYIQILFLSILASMCRMCHWLVKG